MPDASVLSRIAERLKREMGAEHVIVYGSVARGEATHHSDLDLLVIAPSAEKPFDRFDRARDAIGELSPGLEISPLVLTPEEVQRRLEADDRFVRQIIDRGIEVRTRSRGYGGSRRLAGQDARSRWGGVRPMPGAQASRSWREHAKRDWKRLQVLLSADDGPGGGIFLQQALEKYLKGWLLDHGWELQKTHHLDLLLADACAYDAALRRFQDLAARASKYYLADRYPDEQGQVLDAGPNAKQARLDVEEARHLVAALFPDEDLD
ncbi:MAG TPA: HEPN domain-containing protein [Chloroflexota bacterium]|nr:HEPN domain-containing protein [Chloroflexota bacterium]